MRNTMPVVVLVVALLGSTVTAGAQAPTPMSQTASPSAAIDTKAPDTPTKPKPSAARRDFDVDGYMSTASLLGAPVRNADRETVGKVEDVFVDDKGAVQTIVVSVGGFLGLGAKSVAVKWTDIAFKRDGDKVVLVTGWTRESLKAMPDRKDEHAPGTGG